MWLVPYPVFALWLEQTERNTEDLALIERVKRRDEHALAKLYDRYAQLLYTLALRIVSTSDKAEDVLQEVFLQIWNRPNTYMRERGTVYSWAVMLTRNKAIDRVRSKRYRQHGKGFPPEEAGQTTDSQTTNSQQVVILKDYQEIVVAAQKKLSGVEAKILDLSYYGGYSQTEIAKILKMPLSSVKTTMRRGIIKLRQAVTQTGRSK